MSTSLLQSQTFQKFNDSSKISETSTYLETLDSDVLYFQKQSLVCHHDLKKNELRIRSRER